MSVSRGDLADNVAENRHRFLTDLSISQSDLAIPIQVSQAQVQVAATPGKYPQTDALISTESNVYLSVLTADCAPVLFWSTTTELVGAVHSGWQGSELNILGRCLELALKETQVDMTSVHMVVGPGLSEQNFEVGPEFKTKFPEKYLREKPGGDKYHFDNNAFLRDTALQYGVPADQIEILPHCSFADDALFYSHRRDHGTTGRMMSIIGMRR